MNNNSNYKYVIVISGFILMSVAFSIVNSVSAFFVAPVTKAMNFSISEFSLMFTINAIIVSISSPIIGKMINKVNIKIIMSIGSILAGGGYMLYGLANNMFQFYIIGVIVSIGICSLTTIPISTMISDWFEPEKKGSIMGIVFAGIGTGTFFWVQIVSRLLEKYSYRLSYMLLGFIVLVVALPISIFIAKRPDNVYINKKETTNNKKKDISFSEISKTPAFWSFAIGLMLMGISFAGVKQHVQSYLSVLGYSLKFTANISSILAVVGLTANILGGIAFDKIKTKKVLAVIGFFSSISFVFLILAANQTFTFIFTICFGMTMCMASIWPAYGVSRIFSNENYSVIFGVVSMFFTIGASIGPFLSGVIADTSYGYQSAWILYFVITIIYYLLFIRSIKNS
ncbi:MFS transporter [Romboutsia weinsteinii]|uniref:MFS transporter n=1 Tax=Romboutsia weinsteinii TaxID=2020949 RepID=A0A371J535_9FIRM|nr:MFS transporter [Romboutsia weinsteinii]RDY27901.1 MFS transporter [Romboutsia weinsteinii]